MPSFCEYVVQGSLFICTHGKRININSKTVIYFIVYDEGFREGHRVMKGCEFGKDNFWVGSKVDLKEKKLTLEKEKEGKKEESK